MVTHVDPMPQPAPNRSMTQLEFDQANAARIAAEPVYTAQFNAAVAETNANNLAAQASAMAAAASAQASESSAWASQAASNATKWISGTTYADGAVVWSPISRMPYRRNGAGAGTTDPALDGVNWNIQLSPIGLGGTAPTGNVTLTAASEGSQSLTATTFGQSVTLPDATTCLECALLFTVAERSTFGRKILNSAGTLIGFIPAMTTVTIGLADNAVPAGVWTLEGAAQLGITAQYVGNSSAVAGLATRDRTQVIPIDASRTMFLNRTIGANASLYAVIYDSSTLLWGAPALVRAAIDGAVGQLLSGGSVLIAAVTGTAFAAVVLSTSGTTITVNMAATATSTNSISGSQTVTPVITAVGASYIVAYAGVSSSYSGVRAITVSGTTPTVGTESVIAGYGTNVMKLAATSASTFFAVAANTSGIALTVKGFTLSAGTTLTDGASVTNANFAGSSIRFIPWGARWLIIFESAGTTLNAVLVTCAAAVPTLSEVANILAGGGGASGLSGLDYYVNGSRMAVAIPYNTSSLSVLIFLDTSGTLTKPAMNTTFTSIHSQGVTAVPSLSSGNNGVFIFNGQYGVYKATIDLLTGATAACQALPGNGAISGAGLSVDMAPIRFYGAYAGGRPINSLGNSSGTYFISNSGQHLHVGTDDVQFAQGANRIAPSIPVSAGQYANEIWTMFFTFGAGGSEAGGWQIQRVECVA
jgi:hypothetical protein